MAPAPSAAQNGTGSSAADVRLLGRFVPLLAAVGGGGVIFLCSWLVFGNGPWRALRFMLMYAAVFACVHSFRWRERRAWQGWALGFVAAFVVAALWSLLGLPGD